MKPDKFKKRHRSARVDDRVRRGIATEAARRLLAGGPAALPDASEAEYYTAKRKAAAVLGHAVRPGDLPSDAEVRARMLALAREGGPGEPVLEPDEAGVPHIAEHLDRFAIYKLRLVPLEDVKQNPKSHPEGDALYHSLQVFEHARAARPYDEEFLLAALLHDVGKAIDPRDHIAAALESLRGTLSPRTAWLIEHHHDLWSGGKPLSLRDRQAIEASEWYDDLHLLREVDEAGTAVGAVVGTIDEALAYLRGLERESYLDDLPTETHSHE